MAMADQLLTPDVKYESITRWLESRARAEDQSH